MIEIQKVAADNGRRFVAFLLDTIPITILVYGVFYFFFDFDEILTDYFASDGDLGTRIGYLIERNKARDISFLTWVIYCAIMEASPRQATFGKMTMDIKVVDASGKRMTFSKSLARNLCKILSKIPLWLGFIWILFDKRKQSWHDKLSKTYVVDTYMMERMNAVPPIPPAPPLPTSEH